MTKRTSSVSPKHTANGTTHSNGKRSFSKWVGFVRWSANQTFHQAMSTAETDVEVNLDYLADECMRHGYRLSVQWSLADEVWDVGLYGAWEDSKHPGWMLNARNVSLQKAIAGLRVVHEVIYLGEWPLNGQASDYNW